ncbi:hypothetical protein BCAH1134_C0390 (plasmid) [Bacillus cereus AH1134]|nr:hypothetical protein BCAH1134_C0390 [Bacillus cereus AH1134]
MSHVKPFKSYSLVYYNLSPSSHNKKPRYLNMTFYNYRLIVFLSFI